ncbi:MAG: DNA-directed RNA polymerase subunit A' [Candidatus Woesearchaeota archaeon]
MDESDFVHKEVESITFGLFSPKMIKRLAAAKVVTPELYDKEGYPVDGGLMDTRMGVIDPGLVCRTDGRKLKDCLGHFGYIELARPIVHIKFINVILNILRCTCQECGRVLTKNPESLVVEDEPESDSDDESGEDVDVQTTFLSRGAKGRQIKSVIADLKSVSKCPHCGAKQGKITIEKPTTFLENEKRISPIEIRTRLERVSDDDLKVFGLDGSRMRPEWMVLTIMAIPPVTMRPSITLESGERSEDDLTHKLGDIVRINQRLFENINAGAPEIIIEDLWDLLQYHVTTFFDNAVAQLPPARHRSGQPLKTITERIKSKEGRIRHNLAGKRTNFCARTVISPDPKLEFNEVGVPKEIAMNLTVPEQITEWNVDYLKKFILNGAKKYPGANYILRPDGKRKKITDETKEQFLEEIQPGYIVERHLLDGDIALFNRQPSLHRMSMMCHKVRVLPHRTLRMNPAVCHPYNADFDGDEMNLHIPQTPEARAEAEILMQVQTQLISPAYGLSIIGCMQDSISGNYILTKKLEFNKENAIAILSAIGMTDFSKITSLKKDTVTGKEVFSATLPNDFNFRGKSKADNDEVIIKDGVLISGCMDKKNLGEGSGLMLRNLHKQYGPDKAIEIIGNIFRLGIEILLRYGFSMAISDVDLPKNAREKVEEVLSKAEDQVDMLIEEFNKGLLEAIPGRSEKETLELKILEILNRARNEAGKAVQENVDKTTNTIIMIDSGARGNLINPAQMSACVGQQAFRGRRIEKGYSGRTLSCFEKGDLKPHAHGFVRGGYKSGLKPHEFFFAAMTGRDSLMDTALRTPKSGYLYRRLANALQDMRVDYDGTVRDANQRIVQFEYGEDSIDVSRSEGGKINVKKIIQEQS